MFSGQGVTLQQESNVLNDDMVRYHTVKKHQRFLLQSWSAYFKHRTEVSEIHANIDSYSPCSQIIMPARGSFSVKRKEFLESKRPDFATAVENKHTIDGLAVILRQYFKRFPVELEDHIDPTDEALAAVDDAAPDPDIQEPLDLLGPEEYAAALSASQEHQFCVQAKRGVSCALFGLDGAVLMLTAANCTLVHIPIQEGQPH